MEKRERVVYLYLGILILGAFLAVYLFNLQLTGFVVFQQSTQGDFDQGVYLNTSYNGSAIVLNSSANATSGTYTSNILDGGSSVTWNNLTSQEYVPSNTSFSWMVRSCTDVNCSNNSFATVANLSNVNLTGQYFQYQVVFSGYSSFDNLTNQTTFVGPSLMSVSVGSSSNPASPGTSVTASQPSGTKTSGAIPLQFTATGDNLTCWYDVKYASDNSTLINAQQLSGCSNVSTTFQISEGDAGYNYVVNLYVNGSGGFVYKSLPFLVTTKTGTTKTTEEEETPIVPNVTVTPVPEAVTDLILQTIETSKISPSDSKNLNLVVRNSGNTPITACKLTAGGDYALWASIPDETKNFNEGEEKSFAFSINIPNSTVEGNYVFPLSVSCAEITKPSEFTVTVEKKKVEFNITSVERTRSNRVVVTYSLKELLNEKQTVQLQFFLYDAGNQAVANASQNQTLSARQNKEFSTNIPINASLDANSTLTLSANLNSEQYSVSVREPITLGTPTGFFVLGENLGTTGNVLAIVILIGGGVAVYFFIKKKGFSKKFSQQQ